MLELLQKLLYLDWRRHGAVIREASVARSHMWYADFAPRLERPSGPELVEQRSGRRRRGAGGSVDNRCCICFLAGCMLPAIINYSIRFLAGCMLPAITNYIICVCFVVGA